MWGLQNDSLNNPGEQHHSHQKGCGQSLLSPFIGWSKLAGLQGQSCRTLCGCEGQGLLWFPKWPESVIVASSSSDVQISVLSTTTDKLICLGIQNRFLQLLSRAPDNWFMGFRIKRGKADGVVCLFYWCGYLRYISIMFSSDSFFPPLFPPKRTLSSLFLILGTIVVSFKGGNKWENIIIKVERFLITGD